MKVNLYMAKKLNKMYHYVEFCNRNQQYDHLYDQDNHENDHQYDIATGTQSNLLGGYLF